jgi:hypothetical protein
MSVRTAVAASLRGKASPKTRKINLVDVPRLTQPMVLECGQCKTLGRYKLGTIVVDPQAFASSDADTPVEKYTSFTAYVRCRQCNAGGPWKFAASTKAFLTGLMFLKLSGEEQAPLAFCALGTFDGRKWRYATESEAHLKGLIEGEPDRAFLHLRLGNLYRHADRPDLAQPCYLRALELDPADIEARSMYAELLSSTNRPDEAVPHWQAILAQARTATKIPLEMRRSIVRAAFEGILYRSMQTGKDIQPYPPGHEPELAGPRDEPLVLEVKQFDPSNEGDMREFVDGFLGIKPKRRRRPLVDLVALRRRRSALAQPAGGSGVAEHSRSPGQRNGPCPCGSGRKYKKCCGRT